MNSDRKCVFYCFSVFFFNILIVFFDKNEYALLWMVLACFSHVFIVFLLRSVLWTIEEPRKIQKAEKDNNLESHALDKVLLGPQANPIFGILLV